MKNTQLNSKNFNIAMAVLSSFWWMFNDASEIMFGNVSYGHPDYVKSFCGAWKHFMSDLEDKNEELYSILSELTDKQIKEMAGE
jgi:hypothetical protein